MAGLRAGKTLFEAVPALGAVSAHGGGAAKLMPVGFDHPGLELIEGINKIGRDPSQNNHVISSSHISRAHCEILVNEGQIWVKDLGSHNGTYINGERVTKAELKPGDKLGLSRRVTFVLGMDEDLQKPMEMEVDMLDGAKTQISPSRPPEPALDQTGPPAAATPEPAPTPQPPPPPPAPRAPSPTPAHPGLSTTPGAGQPSTDESHLGDQNDDDEPDQAALLKQVEQQRNVLAILYQISLRCLMADNQKEIEQLLTNVLQRLVPMDSGFILYQQGTAWRASVCPNSKYPPGDATVKAIYKLASEHQNVLVLEAPEDMQGLGLDRGSAMCVPMVLNDQLSGVVGTISQGTGVYTTEIVDIMKQLANVSAAALRNR
jgi:pSer/pThr/pTyr-binding forkhead associated (FHA) protein